MIMKHMECLESNNCLLGCPRAKKNGVEVTMFWPGSNYIKFIGKSFIYSLLCLGFLKSEPLHQSDGLQ